MRNYEKEICEWAGPKKKMTKGQGDLLQRQGNTNYYRRKMIKKLRLKKKNQKKNSRCSAKKGDWTKVISPHHTRTILRIKSKKNSAEI